MDKSNLKLLKMVLRIGVFGTFLGHGVLALQIHPQWISFFAVVNISADNAVVLMPIIGVLDIIIAVFALFYPIKSILIWAVFWTFVTALMRPLSGTEIWPFVERWSLIAAPLALLIVNGLPKKLSDLLKI